MIMEVVCMFEMIRAYNYVLTSKCVFVIISSCLQFRYFVAPCLSPIVIVPHP